MAKLAEYFVFYQHYKPSQITILTPYLGQKRIVKELLQGLDDKRKGSLKPGAKRLAPMSAEAEELMAENEERFAPVEKKDKEKKENEDDNHSADHVVVATVDDYQGEENKIILLTLVRSNKEGAPLACRRDKTVFL